MRFLLTALLSLSATTALPCTSFEMPRPGANVFAKSFDWHQGHGLAIVNKRNVAKTALTLAPGTKAASWISRYGSLTFNQVGRDLPLSGINEKGLVMEILWLDSSVYEKSDRASVNEFQFIQFLLDRAAYVAEAKTLAQTVRVDDVFAKVHWLACDAAGACATFEFLNGELTIHDGTTLTNDTYADSLAFLNKHLGFGGSLPLPTTPSSLDRFVRASARSQAAPAENRVAYAFGTLDAVSAGDYSKWNLVYETNGRRVHFRTFASPKVKTVALDSFDYSCKTPVKIIDIDTVNGGDITSAFVDYTPAANYRIAEQTLKPLAAHFPPQVLPLVAHYPDSSRCQE